MNARRIRAEYWLDSDPCMLLTIEPGRLIANIRVRCWTPNGFTCPVRPVSAKKPYHRVMR